jgi:hypothetical protein
MTAYWRRHLFIITRNHHHPHVVPRPGTPTGCEPKLSQGVGLGQAKSTGRPNPAQPRGRRHTYVSEGAGRRYRQTVHLKG